MRELAPAARLLLGTLLVVFLVVAVTGVTGALISTDGESDTAVTLSQHFDSQSSELPLEGTTDTEPQQEASEVTIEVQPENSTAGESITASVSVTDSGGSPVSGVDVTVTEEGNNYTFDNGTVTQATNSDGVAVFDDLVIETADDGYQLQFEAEGVTATSEVFVVVPADPDTLSVETQPQETEAGEILEGPPEAMLTDEFGNPVTGFPVQAINLDGEFDNGTTFVQTENGSATFDDLVIEDPGSYQIQFFEDSSSSSATTDEFDVFRTATGVEVVAQPVTSQAGEPIEASEGFPTVSVTDGSNGVQGVPVTVEVSEGDGNLTTDSTTTVETDEFGFAQFDDLVIETAGENYRVAFSIDDADGTVAASDTAETDLFDVTPGQINSITATIDGDTEPTVLAQEEQTITVTAEDEFGNPVEGQPISVDSIDDTGDNVTVTGVQEGQVDGTDADGQITYPDVLFEGESEDTVDITFSFGEAPGTPFEVMTVTLSEGVTNVTAAISGDTDPTVPVGTSQTVTVTAEDLGGNPVENETITIDAIDDGDVTVEGLAVGDEAETNSAGNAAFTGVTFVGEVGETVAITVSAGDGISDTMVVTLDTGPLATITADIDGDTEPTVLVGADQTITLTAEDAGGNPIENAEIGVYEINDSGDGVTVSGLDEDEFDMTDGDGLLTFDDVAFDGDDGATVDLTFRVGAVGPDSTTTDTASQPEPYGPLPGYGVEETMTVTLETPEDDRDPAPAPGSAAFELDIVETNAPVMEGRALRVTAEIENVGDATGTRSIEFAVANHTAERSITLDAGGSTEATFRWDTTADDVGNHTVEMRVDGSVATKNVTVYGERPRYLTGAIYDDSPDRIHLTFDQRVRLSGVIPDTDGFTVVVGGETLSLADVRVEGQQAILELERSVAPGQTVLVSYDGESDNLQSLSGVEAEAFDEAFIDNRVETTPPIVATVTAMLPGVDLVADTISVGTDVNLLAIDSQIPVGASAVYDWEVNGETFTTDEPELTRTFDEPGEVTAQVTVTADGQSATASVTFDVVDDQPPEAHLTASDTVETGEDPGFDASDSTDNVAISGYAWDFGDGTTEEGDELSQPAHTYDDPGEYEVTVTVTDTSGNAETATVTVTVEEPEEAEASATPWPWLLLALIIVGVVLSGYYYYRRRR